MIYNKKSGEKGTVEWLTEIFWGKESYVDKGRKKIKLEDLGPPQIAHNGILNVKLR